MGMYITTAKQETVCPYRNDGCNQKQYQSELPRSIPKNSVESDHGCTSRIYFDTAGDYVTLMSQKTC